MFTDMKKWLRVQHFAYNELQIAVTSWLNSQAAEFYEKGIGKLVECYDKYLNVHVM